MSETLSGQPAAPAGLLAGRAVLLLALAAFVSSATLRAVDPLVPAIAAEFRTTPGGVGLVITAFTLAYGVCQLLWGPVGDRFGKFRVVALACLFSAATAGSAALAWSLPALAALRLLSGMTAAAIIPLSMAFIGDHVAYEQRQATLARFMSGQILGLVAGQIVGGMVSDWLSWRALFVILAGLFLLPGLLLWRELRLERVPPPILGAGMGPARLAATWLGLWRRPWPRTVLLTVMLEGVVFFGPFGYISAHLHTAFALDYAVIGAILATFGLGGIVYALNVGVLVRRLGEKGLAGWGGALLAFGYAGLALAPSPALAVPAIVVVGLGFYMLHATLQTNATQMAPEARGFAVAAFASSFFIGQGLGAWVGGLAADHLGLPVLFLAAAPAILLLGGGFARQLRHRPRPA